MSLSLVLPRLTAFRVRGFQPIFSSDVHLTIKSGPCLILGGNGLGKTTLMQAIVYGLTGGVSDEMEEERRMRWGHSYFRSRVSPESGRTANVEVSFRLGKEQISVRRGLAGSDVIALRASSQGTRWVEAGSAGLLFEDLLRTHGGYESVGDFGFVVTRLLYLPENRRLIAWDTDAQTRILMLVNRDVSVEQTFRNKRKQLKLMDSRKRHIHVQVGHASTAMSNLDEEIAEDVDTVLPPGELELEELPALVQRFAESAKLRIAATNNLGEIEHAIEQVSSEIDDLQLAIEGVESKLVSNLLASAERENNLAIHKLLESGICPCCGTRQRNLQDTARQYHKEQKCCICGSEQPQTTNPELTSMRLRLADHLATLQANEQAYAVLEQRLNAARRAETDLQARINEVRFRQPVLNIPDQVLAPSTRQDLLRRKRQFEAEEAELEMQIRELQSELEAEYTQFLDAMKERLEGLRKAYEQYATEFMGITCRLTSTEQPDRLLELTAFVPEFGGAIRPDAESCSEAQRFFLDIAFRMALIDLASNLSGFPSCFICETPENALDVSYIDNVVKMFRRFTGRRHTLLFSANLQDNGIAQKIMAAVPKGERHDRVANLLEYGQLTNVHRSALSRLKALAKKVMD